MSAIFLTATGTDIGKTFVAAGLIRHCRSAGRPIDVLKPLVTGFDPGNAMSDSAILLAALGRQPSPDNLDQISPWRFAAPLSPDMAAREEDRSVDFDGVIQFCQQKIAPTPGTLLIEGIGGVMVPLDARHTVLDWMAALRIPVLLVTGSYLGTLSHTLTALDALQRRDLAIKALVVNETPGATVTLGDTLDTLSNFAGSVPIVALPRDPAPDAFGRLAALL